MDSTSYSLRGRRCKECDVKGVHDETAPIRNVPINPEEQEENVSPELAQAEQEFI